MSEWKNEDMDIEIEPVLSLDKYFEEYEKIRKITLNWVQVLNSEGLEVEKFTIKKEKIQWDYSAGLEMH
jgi:hypothetical protein